MVTQTLKCCCYAVVLERKFEVYIGLEDPMILNPYIAVLN